MIQRGLRKIPKPLGQPVISPEPIAI